MSDLDLIYLRTDKKRVSKTFITIAILIALMFLSPLANPSYWRVQVHPSTPLIALEYTVDNGTDRYIAGRETWHLMGRYQLLLSRKTWRKTDPAKFVEDLEKGIEQGDINAYYIGSLAAYKGVGIKRDIKRSRHLLQLAAEGGHVAAQDRIGRGYMQRRYGFERDLKKADRWLSKAASNGHPRAAYFFSEALLFGTHGMPKDCERSLAIAQGALPYYYKQPKRKKSERKPYFDIAGILGTLHLQDCKSLKARPKEAIQWLERSYWHSQQPEAAAFLGGVYEYIPEYRDMKKAEKWYRKAKYGSPLAKKRIEEGFE